MKFNFFYKIFLENLCF